LVALASILTFLTTVSVHQLVLLGFHKERWLPSAGLTYGDKDGANLVIMWKDARRSTTEYNFIKRDVIPVVLPTPGGRSPGPALSPSASDGDMSTVIQHTEPCLLQAGKLQCDYQDTKALPLNS